MVYVFPLKESTDIQVDARLSTGSEKGVSCRLYLLGENGLAEQYYLGFEQESSCTLKVSLPKGNYQLEVRPGDADAAFTVVTKKVKGDGNDGFDEAITLEAKKSKGGQLAVADVADWYKFAVSLKGKHVVNLYGEDVECLIYPLADVDLFGFSTPVCGEEYEYPKGSYVVQVKRKNGVDEALNYSVQLD